MILTRNKTKSISFLVKKVQNQDKDLLNVKRLGLMNLVPANRIEEIRQIRVRKLQDLLKSVEKVTRESLEWPNLRTLQMSGANSVLPKIKMMLKEAKESFKMHHWTAFRWLKSNIWRLMKGNNLILCTLIWPMVFMWQTLGRQEVNMRLDRLWKNDIRTRGSIQELTFKMLTKLMIKINWRLINTRGYRYTIQRHNKLDKLFWVNLITLWEYRTSRAVREQAVEINPTTCQL